MLEKVMLVLEWYSAASDQDLLRDRGKRAHDLLLELPDDFASRFDACMEEILPHLPDSKAASNLGDLLSEMESES